MIKTVIHKGLEFELETDAFRRNVLYSKDYYYISWRELKYFHKLQKWLGIKFGPKIKKYSIAGVPSYNRTIFVPNTSHVEGIITNYDEVIEISKRNKKIDLLND